MWETSSIEKNISIEIKKTNFFLISPKVPYWPVNDVVIGVSTCYKFCCVGESGRAH